MDERSPSLIRGESKFEPFLPIEPSKLYEAIIVIKWPNEPKYNTSAMGVRFGPNNEIFLRPYPDTDTYDLLTDQQVEIITINFTDDVELFAIAALSGLHSSSKIEELDHSYLDVRQNYAFVNKAQMVILGKIVLRDHKIQLHYENTSFDTINQVSSEFSVNFQIEQIETFHTLIRAQPVNRGDNLALEAVVYASKIPALQKQENSFQQIQEYVDKIRSFQYDIRRFSASRRALTVCNIIDNFLDKTI